MKKCRASITQRAPDDTSARAQTELHCRDDVGDLKNGSLVPTLPQSYQRLAVIRKMEPQRIDYHFAT
jgi:hypothetical protein